MPIDPIAFALQQEREDRARDEQEFADLQAGIEIAPAPSAPAAPTGAEGDAVSAQEFEMLQKGEPIVHMRGGRPEARIRQSLATAATAEELRNQPIGETIERGARVLGGNIVGPGGAGGVIAAGAGASQFLDPYQRLMSEVFDVDFGPRHRSAPRRHGLSGPRGTTRHRRIGGYRGGALHRRRCSWGAFLTR